MDMNDFDKSSVLITDEVLKGWQEIVNLLALIIEIPAGLIMRLVKDDIEVFVSSATKGNPYKPGDSEYFQNSGLYCEAVINSNQRLLVPNALKDNDWKNNPDIKLGMVSYLGFPILYPNNQPFGTICVLDRKENHYSANYIKLIASFRDMVESQLELVYTNHILGEQKTRLTDYIAEIKELRGIIPICANCKKIRDEEGYWTRVEDYIEKHTNANFTHGICNECSEKIYGDQSWYKKKKLLENR